MGINAPTPILNLPVAVGVDGTYWVPAASTNGSPTERVNVETISGIQGSLDAITNVPGSVLYRGASKWEGLDPGISGYVLSTRGQNSDPEWISVSSGSVSSVGLSLPSIFNVTGSPVTSSGTLTGTLATQSANRVFAGPTNGAAAAPTFRAIANADIASGGAALTKIDDANVTLTLGGSPGTALVNAASLSLGWTGTLAVTRGGTGLGSAAQGDLLYGSASNTLARLSKSTSGYSILSNTGTSNNPAWVIGREVLSANRTYYVRTDGSNSNDGLTNSSGGAFLTIQKAYDVIAGTLDLGGNTVTISVQAGTYTGGLSIIQPWTGGGGVAIDGNGTANWNTSSSTASWSVPLPGLLTVSRFASISSSAANTINGSAPGTCVVRDNNYTAGSRHLVCTAPGAQIIMQGTNTLAGNALNFFYVSSGALVSASTGTTLTITGTPAITTFAQTVFGAILTVNLLAISGATTGNRYSAISNSIINTSGGGANFFPGSVAGSTSTGGLYL